MLNSTRILYLKFWSNECIVIISRFLSKMRYLGKSLCLSLSFDMASATIVQCATYFQLGMEVLAPVS